MGKKFLMIEEIGLGLKKDVEYLRNYDIITLRR